MLVFKILTKVLTDFVLCTLRELIFAGINFHEFREN